MNMVAFRMDRPGRRVRDPDGQGRLVAGGELHHERHPPPKEVHQQGGGRHVSTDDHTDRCKKLFLGCVSSPLAVGQINAT